MKTSGKLKKGKTLVTWDGRNVFLVVLMNFRLKGTRVVLYYIVASFCCLKFTGNAHENGFECQRKEFLMNF